MNSKVGTPIYVAPEILVGEYKLKLINIVIRFNVMNGH